MKRRIGRRQITIAGALLIVALTAIVLGLLVEARRIKRTQALYLKESAKYAQLEKHEIAERSIHLQRALILKKTIEFMEERRREEGARDHFFVPSQPADRFIGSQAEAYNRNLKWGRESLVRADVARTRAQRFGELRRSYKEAGNCLWLPFGPNPLKLPK
jgi:hypothetical protein